MIVDLSILSILQRIRTWDYRTQTRSSKGQRGKYAFRQLNSLKEKLALPSPVLEKAAYIYRKAQRNEIIRGRTRIGAMAACVYIACREAIIPRTIEEVAEVSNIKRKEMWYAYISMVLELGLKIPLIDLIRCVVKLANKTGVNEKNKRAGIELYETGYRSMHQLVEIQWDLPQQFSIWHVKTIETEVKARSTLPMLLECLM